MPAAILTERAEAVRAFNRFYTRVIGLLDAGLLGTRYSLTEARVIFELAQRDGLEVTELRRELELDSGYLSRLLAHLESDQLITRERSASDGRRRSIRLTRAGRKLFSTLDRRSTAEIEQLLAPLGEQQRRRLIGAMDAIRGLLAPTPRPPGYVLRAPAAGDYGWVVQRHGAMYAQEYGWDESFEAFVARIVADFVERRDARRESGWIAELDGERVGCVFCTRGDDDQTAQLRLLLIDPATRGMGIGTRLVEECLRFARRAGYRRIVLWTNDVLVDARRVYERAGFQLDEQSPHRSFGADLVGQHWSREL
jgi:DNA-binding MarR family transcriptional regulator/GNAT superfamily N-acetyltransferase